MKKNLLFILLSFCAFCVFTAIGVFLVFTSSNQNSDSADWFYCYAYANGGSVVNTSSGYITNGDTYYGISNSFSEIWYGNDSDPEFSDCYECWTTAGSTIYLPQVSWPGNTFLGWWYQYGEPVDPNHYNNEYIRSSTSYDWNRNYDTPSSTRYYIAVWQINYYTVTIQSNSSYGVVTNSSYSNIPGGSYFSTSSTNLSYYNNALNISSPTISSASAINNEQYNGVFTGWSGVNGVIASNRTVTANFSGSEKTYWTNINIYSPDNVEDYASGTMTVNYNGSSVSGVTNEEDRYLPYSGYIQISSISPATGMHLSSVSGATDQGNGVYRRTVGTGGEINIYMAWNTYSVVYNANGGSGTAPTSHSTEYNVSITLRNNTFTRTGYSFLGWSTNSGATSASYSPGTSVSRLTSTNGATVNLYAIWKINNYNVTLNTGSNGFLRTYDTTDNLGTSKTWSVPYNSSISGGGIVEHIWINGYFDVTAIVMTGYTFVSWSQKNGDKTPAYNLTVTATSRANTYTIEFNSNGGSGTMNDLAMTYNVGKNLTKNTFTNNGKVFAGWSTSSNATSPTYYDERFVSNLTATDNGVVTLYAVWLDSYTETSRISRPAGGGTENNPYKVSSASELAWIASEVNFNNRKGIYIQQTANITFSSDLHWNPIGTKDNPFYGVYDGQGFIIEGLTTRSEFLDGQGLFGYVGGVVMEGVARGATIKNVRLLNANIVSDEDAGAIVGQTRDSSSQYPTLIQNCFIRANVSGSDDTGGIIGQTGSYTTIENCVFIGNLYSLDDESDYIAAILPYIAGDEDTVIVKNVYVESNRSAFYDNTGITTNIIGKRNGNKYIESSNGFEGWIISADGTPLPGGMTWLEEGGNCAATTEDIQNWKNS